MCNILHVEETCDQCGRIITRTSQRMNCLEKRILNNKFRNNWHATMDYYCPNGVIEEDYKPVSVDQCKQCWSDSRDITQGKDMPCYRQAQDGEPYRKSFTPGSEPNAIQMTVDVKESLQAQHPPLPRDAEIYPPPVSESARAKMPRRWTQVHKDRNQKKEAAPPNGEKTAPPKDEGPIREGPVGPSRLITQLGGHLVNVVSEMLTPQESP